MPLHTNLQENGVREQTLLETNLNELGMTVHHVVQRSLPGASVATGSTPAAPLWPFRTQLTQVIHELMPSRLNYLRQLEKGGHPSAKVLGAGIGKYVEFLRLYRGRNQ